MTVALFYWDGSVCNEIIHYRFVLEFDCLIDVILTAAFLNCHRLQYVGDIVGRCWWPKKDLGDIRYNFRRRILNKREYYPAKRSLTRLSLSPTYLINIYLETSPIKTFRHQNEFGFSVILIVWKLKWNIKRIVRQRKWVIYHLSYSIRKNILSSKKSSFYTVKTTNRLIRHHK